jgi:uncharacterized protein YndB with AHSA1/START domain
VSDTELHLERLIAAPPERVFALWSEPEQLVKWWGPDGYDLPSHAIDPHPGGSWRTTMRSPDGKSHTVSGRYRTIEPPRRLVFTWAWEDEHGARGHETEVTVTFAPAPGGTKLVLVQKEFDTKDSRDRHEHGWASSFDRLSRAAG